MALTQEQQNRIAELLAEKQGYIEQRSLYYDKKSRITDVLNDIENIWNNAYPVIVEPNENPRLYISNLKSIATSLHGDTNYRDKLHNDLEDAYKFAENEYPFASYSNSTFYEYWKGGIYDKVQQSDRRESCLEIVEKGKEDYNS